MAKTLTDTERLVDEQMLAMLEWGVRAARKVAQDWGLKANKKTAELLAKRGAIEIWPETAMRRIEPKT